MERSESTPYFKQLLIGELSRRVDRNRSYSLRSFAKALQIDAGTLSRIMDESRPLTLSMAQRLADRLGVSPAVRRRLIESVVQTKLGKQQLPATEMDDTAEIEQEVFRCISDISHYAIIELTCTRDFQSDPKWIGRQLGISPYHAKMAIERLVKLGLLERDGSRLRKKFLRLTTKDKTTTTTALRHHQRQVLERAIASLETHPVDRRSMTSATIATNPENLPLAKELIESFSRQICELLNEGEATSVYQLGVSLYPLTPLEE